MTQENDAPALIEKGEALKQLDDLLVDRQFLTG